MSYRCRACGDVVPHNQPQRKMVVYRTNGTIEREIPVCETCEDKSGITKTKYQGLKNNLFAKMYGSQNGSH